MTSTSPSGPGTPQVVRGYGRVALIAPIVNAAHWVFTGFFNVTYGTELRDPFTMYKVFRRECIDGVEFVADRFDFDWERWRSSVRLGYKPIEFPVEYKARSFHGGKKVRFFRDPPTWIVACLRFRFCALLPIAIDTAARGDQRHLANPRNSDRYCSMPSRRLTTQAHQAT